MTQSVSVSYLAIESRLVFNDDVFIINITIDIEMIDMTRKAMRMKRVIDCDCHVFVSAVILERIEVKVLLRMFISIE